MGVQPIRKAVAPEIPDKLYFRIGDVAHLCEVPAYVLRFWETEFPQLKPNKGGTGQRLYRKRDVEMALRIKSLLYDQGYTIPGARQVFKNEAKAREAASVEAFPSVAAPTDAPAPQPAAAVQEAVVPALDPGAEIRRAAQIRAIRDELRAILALLGPSKSAVPAPELRAWRPRLVLEPRLEPRPATVRPEMLRVLRDPQSELLAQGDLFAGE